MNFIIECEDERQQIQVLQKLEKQGYHWAYSGAATNFVPITEDPRGKTIITQPNMEISYALDREPVKEKYKNSHKYVTGSEYLGKTKVIL